MALKLKFIYLIQHLRGMVFGIARVGAKIIKHGLIY
uniref:Uncharacterized protein n=1 Tax=Siphoviridae sp. ctxMM9 TaxID=2827973 RepID=A0A8S5T651_9CAUD|nr:MAG TPA: hypothetical protein [Siphoviridae sp. ctxMM9]